MRAVTTLPVIQETLVLETTFQAKTRTCQLTEALALGKGRREHDLGQNSLALLLRCLTGLVEVRLECAPRFEYGLVEPLFAPEAGGDFCIAFF